MQVTLATDVRTWKIRFCALSNANVEFSELSGSFKAPDILLSTTADS